MIATVRHTHPPKGTRSAAPTAWYHLETQNPDENSVCHPPSLHAAISRNRWKIAGSW
jgi:hypothetical protein